MIYDFSSREKNILHYLSMGDSFIMAKQLSAVTGVSDRTIRTDIKKINLALHAADLDDAFRIVSSHTKGYKIEIEDADQFKQFIKDLDYDTNTMERELVNFREREIRMLAILSNRLSLYRLSQILFFSEHVLRSLIKKVNRNDRKIQYKLRIIDGNLQVIGNEREIRIAVLKTIYVNPEFKGITQEVLKYIQDEEFETNVLNVIKQVIASYEQLNVAQLVFQYIAKLLFVSYRRNQFNKMIEFSESEKQMLQNYEIEFEVSREILLRLKQKYYYLYQEEDVYFLAMILISFSNRRDQVIQEMDNESYELCKFVMKMIVKDFKLEGRNLEDSLMESLSYFFWAFKVRFHFGLSRQYMGVTRVKRKLIVATEYSRKIADTLEKKYDYKISDKEKIFLAVCIANGIENGRKIRKQHLLVASKYGICEAKRVQQQLQNRFEKNIEKIDVCELYEIDRYYDEFDVVLMDDKKQKGRREKMAYYRPFGTVYTMGQESVLKIKQEYDKNWFYHHCSQENFISDLTVKNKEEMIQRMAMELSSSDAGRKKRMKKIAEMDKQLTFECGYRMAFVALIDEKAKQNEVYFMTLNNAISWNQRFVQCFIVVKVKSYLDLQHYEIGIEEILVDSEKCSYFIAEPNYNTLSKILNMDK